MNKVVETNFSKLPPQNGPVGASTTIVAGDLLCDDYTNHAMIPATSSVGTTLTLQGIATNAVTTGGGGSGTVKYIPVSRAVYVVVDCTNNTASNQLCINHAMTDAATVNNTSSNIASTLGVFHALGTVGAASAKKLYGYYNVVGQVTA